MGVGFDIAVPTGAADRKPSGVISESLASWALHRRPGDRHRLRGIEEPDQSVAVRVVARVRRHKFAAARIVLLGIRKPLQNSAIGGAILLAMIEEFRRRGASASIKHLEVGWVLEDNMAIRRPIELFGGKIDKIHRVYEKQL